VSGRHFLKPTDVKDPERPIRYISLAECFALAMENGTVGQNGQSNDGAQILLTGGVPTGQYGVPNGSTDSIRVLSLEPAGFAADIESSLSKFDARFVSSLTWNTTDRPVGTALDSFQAQGAANSIAQQAAAFNMAVLKPLPTGGVAGITFTTDYTKTNLPARVNPSYQPTLQFSFEQPLLQGFGIEINELRAAHPGSILTGNQFQTAPNNGQEGILLTRIRLDQARAEFERNVQTMIENVEIAYWNLYESFGELFAREIALRNNLEIWRITKKRVEAGIQSFTVADLYEAEGQYESSRGDWLASLNTVLERERSLRGLLNLPMEDGFRLVPSDEPALAPFEPDWNTAIQEALVYLPELALAREQLKATQLHLKELKNRALPDVRFTSTYDINGIGTSLDGPNADNALRNLSSNHFNNWSAGLQANFPIGFRDANAGIRQGKIRLAQAYWALQVDEWKTERNVASAYRNVIVNQGLIERYRASVTAYNNDLAVRRETVKAGQKIAIDVTLQAIRLGTAAMISYYQSVGAYNASLATFERAKGTTLRRSNIQIAEGQLPECAKRRAADHEAEKAAALLVRERPGSAPAPLSGPDDLTKPLTPESLSLPELLKAKPAPDPEMLRGLPPRPLDQIRPEGLSLPTRNSSPPATSTSLPPGPAVVPTPATTLPNLTTPTTTLPNLTAPAPSPTTPAPSTTGATGNYGLTRPLIFPDDKKLPPPSISGPAPADSR
jgi:outer membrane protein TolC